MHVGVDEGRRDEPPLGVDDPLGGGRGTLLDKDDLAGVDADIDEVGRAAKLRVLDEQLHVGHSASPYRTSRSYSPSARSSVSSALSSSVRVTVSGGMMRSVLGKIPE